MNVLAWARRVRETRAHGRDLTNRVTRTERSFNARAERVNVASTRAERAAIQLLEGHDDLLNAAARQHFRS